MYLRISRSFALCSPATQADLSVPVRLFSLRHVVWKGCADGRSRHAPRVACSKTKSSARCEGGPQTPPLSEEVAKG
jgi:hypothetical protein